MDEKEKDPAFLFYSNEFYSGTRTMYPEERACFIDLMIYQHQNQYITTDIKRLLMHCTGVDEATLVTTLERKFERCDKGYYNKKLKKVMEEREKYTSHQSQNGKISQFYRKAKKFLKQKDYNKLRQLLKNQDKEVVIELADQLKAVEASFEASYVAAHGTSYETSLQTSLQTSLLTSLEHLGNENKDRDRNKDNIKNKIPDFLKFKKYAIDNQPDTDLNLLELKYKSWVENNWRDGYDQPIKNWKSKLLNTLPYVKNGKKSTENRASQRTTTDTISAARRYVDED